MNKELHPSQEPSLDHLYGRIRELVAEGRRRAAVAVNFATVETYWQVGREIVEEEQGGKDRASYGKYILREMSKRLTARSSEADLTKAIFATCASFTRHSQFVTRCVTN